MKSSLVRSVLIFIATITMCLVDVQSRSRDKYATSDGNSNKNDGGGDGNTSIELLEDKLIPLSFLQKIDEVSNMSEFFEKFVAFDSSDSKIGLERKIEKPGVERASFNIAKASGCIPESTVVPLEPLNRSTEPSIFYFPKCTRVKLCSGCCSSDLLSCQPTEEETLDFTIFKLEYTSKDRMPIREQEHVLVKQHKKCKCDCKVKQENCDPKTHNYTNCLCICKHEAEQAKKCVHCNSYQVYDASQCLCNCTNYDAKNKCLSEGGDRIWDSEACKCRCKETQNCTTGTLFDEEQCKCTEVTGGLSSKTLFDRRRFIVKAVPVEPNNKTIYYDINGK